MPQTTRKIRRELRARRRALSAAEQRLAAGALARRLAREPLFWRSRRIAFYVAQDGEIDPLPLLQRALALHKQCYLPRLQRDSLRNGRRLLEFVRFRPGDPLEVNRFGIPEPLPNAADSLRPQSLDLVLLPLVAFDDEGNRVGMGLGYYDQTFAFTRSSNLWHRPRLVGLAHASQQVPALGREPWDIPLDGVATDALVHTFAGRETGDGNS